MLLPDLDPRFAASVTPDFLRGLGDEELFALVDAVEERVGREVAKVEDRATAAERRLSRELLDDWRGDLDPILVDELLDLPAEAVSIPEVERLLGRTDARMRERDTSSALTSLGIALGAFYLGAKRRVRDLAGESGRRIELTLTRGNIREIGSLSNQGVYWIGEYWGRHLSRTILATVEREAALRGLGRLEVGQILRGAVNGTFPMAAVPGTYRGSPEAYFAQLAGDVRTRGLAFGSVSAFEAGGFVRYRIEAVLDERTSEICRFMHNRTFAVSEGRSLVDRLVSAEDPEDVKSIAGWRTAAEARELAERGDLANAGLALPPYHGRCRTVVVPES